MVTLHTPHKGASRLAGGPRPRLVYSPYKKIHLSKNHSKGEQIALFYQLLRGKKDYVSVIYISFLMATPVRFELTHRGVKFHCLTTWLRGNMAVYAIDIFDHNRRNFFFFHYIPQKYVC